MELVDKLNCDVHSSAASEPDIGTGPEIALLCGVKRTSPRATPVKESTT